ncbi:MAG: DUF4142 domain-containing protein, partial [Steroidobacteraceae bacterium]
GTEGMHGTFQGTQDTTGTGTATGAPNSGSGTTSGGSTSSSAGTVDNDATTSADARATAATGTSQPQGQDALFLRKAAESDRLEIASAQAAIDNATRSDTKMAARMLLQDHQQSSQKLQQIATSKGWALPSAATAESDQARMTSTSGANFDDRFMADQIRMHRDAISLYRQQAASGSDPDLRQFARDQLPHLEHHLEMLQGSHTQK